MPEYSQAPAGAFCWIEVNTTDPAAAKKFYSGLFGWNLTDMPMGDAPYTMADIGGKQVAGIFKLPEEALKMGARPTWLSYIAVDDVDASTAKATSLGAKVMNGPKDVGPGRMTILQDPTGAVFALWKSSKPMGGFLFGEPNSLGWNELMTTDVEKAGKFYSSLFGWRPEAQNMGEMTYTTFHKGDQMVGGMFPQPKEMAGAPSMWVVYFSVADCDATVAKAKSLGAQVNLPPTDIPTIGRFAALADQQGAAFSVIKFLPPAK